MLVDGFGRVATDLRISITDRCNLRCTYCMPAEGMDWLDRAGVLTDDEIDRIAGIAYGLGVRSVRLTGGEPLVRPGVPDLVARLAAHAFEDIALTTNGVLLATQARALAAAGLSRINVSLDSLLADRFQGMTRRSMLEQVRAGLEAADAAGLGPIKINCVVVGGTNDDEVGDFARLARETGWEIRFIEFMPLDADHGWSREQVVPSRVVIERITALFPLEPLDAGHQPARTWRFADGAPGSVGVIASVTEPFCSSCDRIRVTADGWFRTCLFGSDEVDLRAMMRDGASDEQIASAITEAVSRKWAGHAIGKDGFRPPDRPMSLIGG